MGALKKAVFEVIAVIGISLLIASVLRGKSGGPSFVSPISRNFVRKYVFFSPAKNIVISISVKGGAVNVYVYSIENNELLLIKCFRNVTRLYTELNNAKRGYYLISIEWCWGREELEVNAYLANYGIEKDLFQMSVALIIVGFIGIIFHKKLKYLTSFFFT